MLTELIARAIRSEKIVIRSKKIVIHSNGSSYPFKTAPGIVSRATVPSHFHVSRLRGTCQKM